MADRKIAAAATPELRAHWGHIPPDAAAILGAIDVVFGECDR